MGAPGLEQQPMIGRPPPVGFMGRTPHTLFSQVGVSCEGV